MLDLINSGFEAQRADELSAKKNLRRNVTHSHKIKEICNLDNASHGTSELL